MSRSVIHDHVQLSVNSGHDVKNVIYPENTETDVHITSLPKISTLTDLITALGELAFYNVEDIIINETIPVNTYTKVNKSNNNDTLRDGEYVVIDHVDDTFDSAHQLYYKDITYSDGSEPQAGDIVVKTDYRSDVTFSAKKIIELFGNLEEYLNSIFVKKEDFVIEIRKIYDYINSIKNNLDTTINANFEYFLNKYIRPMQVRLSELDDYLDFGSIYSAYYALDTEYIRRYFAHGRKEISGSSSYLFPFQSYDHWLNRLPSPITDGGSTRIKEIIPISRKWRFIPLETMYSERTRGSKTYDATSYQNIDKGNVTISNSLANGNITVWNKVTNKYAEALFTEKTNGVDTSVFGDLCAIKTAILKNDSNISDEEINLLASAQPSTTSKIIMHSYKKVTDPNDTLPNYEVVDSIGLQYFFEASSSSETNTKDFKTDVLMNINNFWNLPNLLIGERTTTSYDYDGNGNIIGTTEITETIDTPFKRLLDNDPSLKNKLETMYNRYKNLTHGGIDKVNRTIELFYIMGDVYDVQVGDHVREIEETEPDYVDISNDVGCVSYKEVREDIHCGIIYAGGFVEPFILDNTYQTYDINVDRTTLPPGTELTSIYPTLGQYYWPFPCNGIIVPDMLKMHNKSRTHQITISDEGIKTSNSIVLANDQKINVKNIGAALSPNSFFNAFIDPRSKRYYDPNDKSGYNISVDMKNDPDYNKPVGGVPLWKKIYPNGIRPLRVGITGRYKVEVLVNGEWKLCYYCAPAFDTDKIYLSDTSPWNSAWNVPRTNYSNTFDATDEHWRGRMLYNSEFLPTTITANNTNANKYRTYQSDDRHPIGYGYTLLLWAGGNDPDDGAIIADWDFIPPVNTWQACEYWDKGFQIIPTGDDVHGGRVKYYNNYTVSTAFSTKISSAEDPVSVTIAYKATQLLLFWRDVLFSGEDKNPFNSSNELIVGPGSDDPRWKKYELSRDYRVSEDSTSVDFTPSYATYRVTKILTNLSKADLSIESSQNHFRLLAKFI